MHSTSITIALLIVVVLIHVSYVDFRFRYREGLGWFWLMNPAPPIMWIARASAALVLIVVLSFPVLREYSFYYWLLGAVMVLHIVTLVLVEYLEPR